MYVGNIVGLLGDNITFTAEAVFQDLRYYGIVSINNFEITGSGDMYDTLEGIEFETHVLDDNDVIITRTINAIKVTSMIEDDIILPSTITSIASSFYGGRSIVGLGVTKINDYAFGNRYFNTSGYFKGNIISVNVAENCDIGAYAFNQCTKLSSFSLMNGTIGAGAFNECCYLTTLKFGENVVITEDKKSLDPLPSFYVSNNAEVYPVYTTIIGKYSQVLDYEWLRSGRILKESSSEKYTLCFQNHYNSFVGIDIESYSDGQVSIIIDDETKTARLIEDTDTRYAGLCVVADGKIYQFMDKVTIG